MRGMRGIRELNSRWSAAGRETIIEGGGQDLLEAGLNAEETEKNREGDGGHDWRVRVPLGKGTNQALMVVAVAWGMEKLVQRWANRKRRNHEQKGREQASGGCFGYPLRFRSSSHVPINQARYWPGRNWKLL